MIYDEILPTLAIDALSVHGYIEEFEDHFAWLFLEDAGEVHYRVSSTAHCEKAAKWFAKLHSRAAEAPFLERLPERGSLYYLDKVHAVHKSIREQLSFPQAAYHSDSLGDILSVCESIDSNWKEARSLLDCMPRTIVHGDFVTKNIFVREAGAQRILVLDWEKAGAGWAAADIAQIHCIDSYWQEIQQIAPRIDRRALDMIVAIGTIFRSMDAISWAVISGSNGDYSVKTLGKLEVYKRTLRQSLVKLGWC